MLKMLIVFTLGCIAYSYACVADPVVVIVAPLPPGTSIVQRPLGSDDKCSAQYNPCNRIYP